MGEVLRGHLGGVSLGSVLQLVEIECFCGTLMLASGELAFFNGEVVDARFLGLTGADAGVEAMVRARGPFSLRSADVAARAALAPVSGLIIESCRVLDEVERMGALPVTRVDVRPSAGEFARFCSVAPGMSVAGAVARAGVHLVRVLDPLLAALQAGSIGLGLEPLADGLRALDVGVPLSPDTPSVPPVTAGPPSAAPTPVPAARAVDARSFDELVFDARRLVRGRAWDEAEATLRRALEIRPGSPIVAQNLNRVRSLRAAE
jgi:hypothetical protein